MTRSLRHVLLTTAAALVLVAAGCKSEEPTGPTPPAAKEQPAAQAPAAQPAPAAPAPAAGGTGGAAGAAAAAPAGEAAAAPQVSEAAMTEAKQTFSQVCSTCHGPAGKGDGPASAGFPVKPRAFSDAEWQKSVTNEHLATVILKGGPAVGKSPLMPANPQLESKPEVVQGLVALVRQMGGQQ